MNIYFKYKHLILIIALGLMSVSLINCSNSRYNSSDLSSYSDENLASMVGEIRTLIFDNEDRPDDIIYIFVDDKSKISYEVDINSLVLSRIHNYVDYEKVEIITKQNLNKLSKGKQGFLLLNIQDIKGINSKLTVNKISSLKTFSTKANEQARINLQINVAFVSLNFKNATAEKPTTELINGIKSWLSTTTWGQVTINTSISDVYQFSINENYSTCSPKYGDDAISLLDNYLASTNSKKKYQRIITIIPRLGECPWGGVATHGKITDTKPYSIVSRDTTKRVIYHEFGHSIGLSHSGVDHDSDGKYTSEDYSYGYDDPSCTMGQREAQGFNAAKLKDLGLLKPGYGLKPVTAGYAVLHSLEVDPITHNEATAFVFGEYIFSYRAVDKFNLASTKGISIHVNNNLAYGNIPSSLLTAVVGPGMIWEDPNSDLKMQVMEINAEKKEALLFFSGDDIPKDSVFDDLCFISGVKFVDQQSDKNLTTMGHFNFKLFPDAYGDCGKKTFQVEISSINEDGKELNDIETLNISSYTFDFNASFQTLTYIPYRLLSTKKMYFFKVKIYLKNKNGENILLHEKEIKRTNESSQPLCKRNPFVSQVFDVRKISANSFVEGNLIIADMNASNCSTSKYELRTGNLNNIFSKNDIQFGESLEDITGSYPGIKRQLFLRAGEVVHLPIRINYNENSVNTSLTICAKNITTESKPALVYCFNIGKNLTTLIDSINKSPFHPTPLTPSNIGEKTSSKCSEGSAQLSSSDGTNQCSYTWSNANAGQSVNIIGSNGGTGSLTCQSNGNWTYTYNCPSKKLNVISCSGGSYTSLSADGTNQCSYTWSNANAGQSVNTIGTNGGIGSLTCQSNGKWTYTYNCPSKNPNVNSCFGGSYSFLSKDGTNQCTYTWPLANAGQTVSAISTNGGTGSLTCQSNGQWTYTYSCPNK